MKQPKVLIGLSGGVDSTVAAALLLRQGYHVEGIYYKNDFARQGEETATKAAARLGIKLHVMDVTLGFRKDVVDYFIASYFAGKTPNPCIVCNRKIKFKYLLEKSKELSFDYVATGHYARIEEEKGENKFKLLKGTDTKKDQSYFLFLLKEMELPRILFPNGGKTKGEIRNIASEIGFEADHFKESQEICFIPNDDYISFIKEQARQTQPSPGYILDRLGNRLGTHSGIHCYTVGQRRGLNIASSRSYYVVEIDPVKNEVIVGREEEQSFIGLVARDVSWLYTDAPSEEGLGATTKIRYRHPGADSLIKPFNTDCDNTSDWALADFDKRADRGNRAFVKFKIPQKAVAPGQAAVFYRNDCLIGGGWIERGIRSDESCFDDTRL